MRKATLLTFWVAGLVFAAISIYLTLQVPLQEMEAPQTLQSPLLIPAALAFLGGVASLVAWIGALVLAARLGAWGWFVAVFLLGSLGVLLLMVFGPDEYSAEGEYVDYDRYDYPDFGSTPPRAV